MGCSKRKVQHDGRGISTSELMVSSFHRARCKGAMSGKLSPPRLPPLSRQALDEVKPIEEDVQVGVGATTGIELRRNAGSLCFVIEAYRSTFGPPADCVSGRERAIVKDGNGL
jgi:hypothetical protein